MNCSECNASMSVLRTDDRGSVIFRRRECRECGTRITTKEMPVNCTLDETATCSAQTEFSIGQLLISLGITGDEGIRTLIATTKMMRDTTTPTKD